MDDGMSGKKVFFLYPPSVIRDNLISHLIEQEYEVYIINDHVLASRVLALYPTSLIFVNLDANLGEAEWEEWIRKTMSDPITATVGIGIVSYNNNENLHKKYLMDIGIQCGFIKLKLGVEESTRILLATLKATEAKGRRKFVRATCEHDQLSSVNIKELNKQVTGNIHDISVVGFSCSFPQDPQFKKNTILHDVQLKLRGSLLKVEVLVFGTRLSNTVTYVMLFTQNNEPSARRKIRAYLQVALQAELDLQIKNENHPPEVPEAPVAPNAAKTPKA